MKPLGGNMPGTPRPEFVYTKQQRIAELARNCPDMAFTTLAHHIDIEWMLSAHARTRKDGAVGVDGQTADDYEVNLEANLQNLLDRAKSGTYVAPPVRRVHIPKAGSPTETRPLGIPTYEDKILQRAVLMVLEPVYETVFLDVSHGFRPGRGAHGALQSLWNQEMKMGGDWIVDVDLRKFFDTIDHGHLREFLKRRVRDGVILRLIGKWLNAGVLEEGVLTIPDDGTPQGGVVSPLLANIFLHYVLDEWFEKDVRPRLQGEAFVIRYADDFVIGVAREHDAKANHGCLAQADEQVRPDGPPGEDTPGAVRTVPSSRLRNRGTGPTRTNDIRLLGIYSLLGAIPARRMGGQTKDGEEPIQASVIRAVGMVSPESASSDQGTAPETHAKAARPFRVLRDYWQLPQPQGFPRGSAKDLETLAVSATPRW
jgi:group II intron reverse transcriptase/maturase